MRLTPIVKTLLLSTVAIITPCQKILAPAEEKVVSIVNNSNAKNITTQTLKKISFDTFEKNLFKARPDGTIYKIAYRDYNFLGNYIQLYTKVLDIV